MGRDKVATREMRLVNRLGMHARPASLFVQTASKFNSEISVANGKQTIDGKSILGLLMMAAGPGTALKISARGQDATEALDALERLIASKFGEE